MGYRPSSRGAGGYRHVLTDKKSLLALRGVGAESEAESVRFHGRRVTKVARKSNTGPRAIRPPEGWEPLNKGARGALGRCRTFQLAENATTGSVS